MGVTPVGSCLSSECGPMTAAGPLLQPGAHSDKANKVSQVLVSDLDDDACDLNSSDGDDNDNNLEQRANLRIHHSSLNCAEHSD